jgi:ribosomal protein S5
MSYRVLVVVGNAKGAGGFGIGKASDVRERDVLRCIKIHI